MTQQINLYDPALRRQREILTVTNLALASLVLLVFVGVAGTWSRSAAAKAEAEVAMLEPQAKSLQDQLLAVGQLVSKLKPDPKLEQELARLKTELDMRQEVLGMLQHGLGPGAVSFAEYLRGLARQTPSGLWLTAFSVNGDGAGMEIRGRTTNPALIPEYVKRLNAEKSFQGRAFASLEMSVPAPPPGTVVTDAPAIQAAPLFHEFTLRPALNAGAAGPALDDASPSAKSPLSKLLPADAGKALANVSKNASGGSQ